MNNLISGVNPLVISSIKWKKGWRCGWHPTYNRLMKRKNIIRGLLGFYQGGLFDGWYCPYVVICGANDKILKQIICDSNDSALALRAKLTEQLNEFLETMKLKND